MHLPPPDPNESIDPGPRGDDRLPEPIVVYAGGAPSPHVERVSDAILSARPGALIVVVRR